MFQNNVICEPWDSAFIALPHIMRYCLLFLPVKSTHTILFPQLGAADLCLISPNQHNLLFFSYNQSLIFSRMIIKKESLDTLPKHFLKSP